MVGKHGTKIKVISSQGAKKTNFSGLPFGQAVKSYHVLVQNLFSLAPKHFLLA